MKTILAATDFSANGNKAVKYAANLAFKFDCQLVLLNSYHIPMGMETGQPVPADVFEELEKECNRDLLAIENEIKRDITDKLDIVRLASCGFASDEILEAAKQYKAGLIVIGTHGQTGLEKVFGTVTTSLLRMSIIPVLAIPASTEYKPIEKVLIASRGVQEISNTAKELINTFTSIYNPKFYIADVLFSKELQYAGSEKGYGAFEFTCPEIVTEENEDVSKGIDNIVHKTDADLLIMFPEKHSLIYRLMYIENTKKVALNTRVPLLAIPKDLNV